jgi:hypothetical protein
MGSLRNCVFLQLQTTGRVLSALVATGIGLVQMTPPVTWKILASRTLGLTTGSERAAPSGAPRIREIGCATGKRKVFRLPPSASSTGTRCTATINAVS